MTQVAETKMVQNQEYSCTLCEVWCNKSCFLNFGHTIHHQSKYELDTPNSKGKSRTREVLEGAEHLSLCILDSSSDRRQRNYRAAANK